jgi:hypothetical protein
MDVEARMTLRIAVLSLLRIRAGAPKPPINNQPGDNMAQTHYSSKTKRRPKNSKRKDPSAATMAALRQLEAAAKK